MISNEPKNVVIIAHKHNQSIEEMVSLCKNLSETYEKKGKIVSIHIKDDFNKQILKAILEQIRSCQDLLIYNNFMEFFTGIGVALGKNVTLFDRMPLEKMLNSNVGK